MDQFIQDLMVIVFGVTLIVLLLVVLRFVHRQSVRLKQLESDLSPSKQQDNLLQQEEENG